VIKSSYHLGINQTSITRTYNLRTLLRSTFNEDCIPEKVASRTILDDHVAQEV